MAKFFKNWFSTHSSITLDKRKSKSKPDVSSQSDPNFHPEFDEKEFAPYDTRRKMFTSRSGRMKHNQKVRGTLRKDLYGEYRSDANLENQGQTITQDLFEQSMTNDDIKKSLENVYNMAKRTSNSEIHNESVKRENRKDAEDEKIDMDQEIEKMFKPVLIETTF